MSSEPPLTKTELINGGQGLIRMLAMRLHRRFHERFELDDLIAFGQVGLAQAAEAYDPARGNQFSTFAYYRIRGAIYEGIEKMGWAGRSVHRRSRFLSRANDLLEYHADPPALDETALAQDAQWLGTLTQQLVMVSFAALDRSDEGAGAVDRNADPQDLIAAQEIHDHLRRLVEKLPDEPRRLIELMYFESYTLQDASERLQISKSWGSRLHARALARLASDLRAIGCEGPHPQIS